MLHHNTELTLVGLTFFKLKFLLVYSPDTKHFDLTSDKRTKKASDFYIDKQFTTMF